MWMAGTISWMTGRRIWAWPLCPCVKNGTVRRGGDVDCHNLDRVRSGWKPMCGIIKCS